MIRAIDIDSTPYFQLADLDAQIDEEPRVYDIRLAEQLGYNRPRKIRETIQRNLSELLTFGGLPRRGANRQPQGGRPTEEYFLNEPQALLICMWSNTSKAAEVRKALIDVFMEYRRSKLETTIPVRAHERRTSTKVDDAVRLKQNIDRLETVVTSLAPAPQNFCAMVVDGQPVFVDVNAYDIDDEPAVVMTHDGGIKIMNATVSRSAYKFAGARSGNGPRVREDHGGWTSNGVVIIGKIVSGASAQHAPTQAVALPAAPAQPMLEYEPEMQTVTYQRRKKGNQMYRDDILRLMHEGLPNREIVRRTGATAWTVSYWRRWLADRTLGA